MRKNDCIELLCHGLGSTLEGVCRHEGLVVFAPGLLPQEKAQVRIVRVEKAFAFGRVERLLTESQDRVTPPCPCFPMCGGCTGQHMRYEATLTAKRQQVIDCLSRIGGVYNPVVDDMVGMENPWRYRNKGAFPVSGTPLAIGCYAERSHRVVDAPQGCLLQTTTSDALVAAVRAYIQQNNLSIYDEKTGRGLLRHIITREAGDGSALLCLSINGHQVPDIATLQNPRLSGILLCENTKSGNVILDGKIRTLWGEDALTETLHGCAFRVSMRSFFQVNRVGAEHLVSLALAGLSLQGGECVWDLYCGLGTFTLPMAKLTKTVIGVEVVPEAVDDACVNARANGIHNVDFRLGTVESLAATLPKPDAVIVDPPRKGMEETALNALCDAVPQKIVYVSCNPSTLSRDVGRMHGKGYRLEKVTPVDMFPWTAHVECVAILQKNT